jgi:beta-mannanase
VLPPAGDGKYWGAFRDQAPDDLTLVSGLDHQVGRRPAILMWYQEWSGQPDFQIADATWLYDAGIVPMLSWEPWQTPKVFGQNVVDQPKYQLSRIAGGAFDGFIRKFATEIRNYGGPLFLRPMHEMNGSWYPWGGNVNGNTPAEFIAAWRHIHDVFQQVGATNVTWVWSVNNYSVPRSPDNQVGRFWPGSNYVDWIGISSFNWGPTNPPSSWHGLDTILRPIYEQLLAFHKPMMITETAAPEEGGDKAQWITTSYADILANYPELRGVIWYDKRDSSARDFRIDSSPAALSAFRVAVADPRWLSADAAQATAVQNPGT